MTLVPSGDHFEEMRIFSDKGSNGAPTGSMGRIQYLG